MNCNDVQMLSPAWLKGDEELATQLEGHLNSCKECQAFVHYMHEVKKDLLAVPSFEPKAGFLDRINTRLSTEGQTLSAESTTQLKAFVKPRSSRHTSLNRVNAKVNKGFFETLISIMRDNWKSPAFHYAFVGHLLFIGLCVFVFQQTGESKKNKNDIRWVRQQAFQNSQTQLIQNGSVDISALTRKGQVYMVQTNSCLRVQLERPASGRYVIVIVDDGKIQLEADDIQKYFSETNEVSLLVYNNGVEVWSKPAIEKYISEEGLIHNI